MHSQTATGLLTETGLLESTTFKCGGFEVPVEETLVAFCRVRGELPVAGSSCRVETLLSSSSSRHSDIPQKQKSYLSSGSVNSKRKALKTQGLEALNTL